MIENLDVASLHAWNKYIWEWTNYVARTTNSFHNFIDLSRSLLTLILRIANEVANKLTYSLQAYSLSYLLLPEVIVTFFFSFFFNNYYSEVKTEHMFITEVKPWFEVETKRIEKELNI